MEELKARVKDREDLEDRIAELGGNKKKLISVRDTYFSGQGEDALKITESKDGSFLRKYEKRSEGFELVKDERIKEPDEKREEMAERHGIKADQRKEQEVYELNGKTVILNSIEGLGDFLIVQGEEVQKKFIEDTIGVEDPEYIEVPFSELEQE
ncbi:MAG: hypothetical protein ABEK16_01665 [Candidatus Nanohalobium sp.]